MEDFPACRLIHVQADPSGQVMAWRVDLGSEKLPTSQPLSNLVAKVAAGSVKAWHWRPFIPARVRSAVSPEYLAQAEAAWLRIGPLADPKKMAAMLDEKQRGQLIAQRAAAIGCGRTQLYRDWVKYLQRGMTADAFALIPRIEVFCPKPWCPQK
ncbi:MAG: hypothetical protein ACT4QA_08035 [Panacagrimonas sp.]